MAGVRRGISPATEAALWALSNGRCYAPGCTAPVVVEVRPGVYRKNAQIAHIRGVRAPRHDPGLSAVACASFGNLLVLCLPLGESWLSSPRGVRKRAELVQQLAAVRRVLPEPAPGSGFEALNLLRRGIGWHARLRRFVNH